MGKAVLNEIMRRQQFTADRWTALDIRGNWEFGWLEEQNVIPNLADRVCVYATGSMARDEASDHSDLDVFVVDHVNDSFDPLSRVENAHLLAALDRIRKDVGFKAFSRGGDFLRPHHFQDMLKKLGAPADDAKNHFTARMLLLLNSRAIYGDDPFRELKRRALDAYWLAKSGDGPFYTIMLINDIRRWWGVLCLNFEERFKRDDANPGRRRLQNLKLRYARALAVYSTVFAIIAFSDNTGIMRLDLERILLASPIQRLELIANRESSQKVRDQVDCILVEYDRYLTRMAQPESSLQSQLSRNEVWRPVKDAAYAFHDQLVDLFRLIEQDKTLAKYCIV